MRGVLSGLMRGDTVGSSEGEGTVGSNEGWGHCRE